MDSDREFEGAMNVDSLMIALQSAGAHPVEAKRFVVAAVRNQSTFVEVFGRGAIVEMANGPRRSLNVRTRPSLGQNAEYRTVSERRRMTRISA